MATIFVKTVRNEYFAKNGRLTKLSVISLKCFVFINVLSTVVSRIELKSALQYSIRNIFDTTLCEHYFSS